MDEAARTQQVPRTDLEEAKRRFDAGTTIFVDVRPPEEYAYAHIPGAISIPVSGPPESYFSLPRDRDIILY